MSADKSSKRLVGVGLLTAITASLCCITPVLALFAGASGMASAFSWIAPARPYLIGITVLVLGFAWYQKLKPRTKEEIQCACEEDEKPSFWQSKKFLGIVTIFAILLLAFPYYSPVFFPGNENRVIIIDKNNIQSVEFNIRDMDCEACTETIKHEINKLNGIVKVDVSYEKGNAIVQFDSTKTNISEIKESIDATGYSVTQSVIK